MAASIHVSSHKKGQTTCHHHKGRKLKIYCRRCKELACLECLSTVHLSHTVCELREVTRQKQKDIVKFIDRTERNELIQIGLCIASVDTLLQDNDSTFDKLSYQLNSQAQKLKQDIDKFTSNTLSFYQEMKANNAKIIQQYKQDLEICDKRLKEHIQECRNVLQRSSVIEIHDTEFEIGSEIRIPVKPVFSSVIFTPNNDPLHHLTLALGDVKYQSQSWTVQGRPVPLSDVTQRQSDVDGTGKTPISEPKVVEEWKSPCNISSICSTSCSQAWTSVSTSLTLLDRKGSFKQSIVHNATLTDICTSPTTRRLWACDQEQNIMEFVDGKLVQRFVTTETPRCLCVTVSDHVIVGMSNHIAEFTADGQSVLTSSACSPYRIAQSPLTHNIAVIIRHSGGDKRQCVVVMDTAFHELFVYTGDIPSIFRQTLKKKDRPFIPTCIVCDSNGNIIIGDWNNQRLIFLSGTGHFLRIIQTDSDHPLAVSIVGKKVLWIAIDSMSGTDNVKLLQ
ncbi:uncharacterized protein [Argopecten irradians]|uniref:uncharacterized protein n=1 Tax=Argopecten irradians TaxID=31199 RepID=UPI00371FEB2D